MNLKKLTIITGGIIILILLSSFAAWINDLSRSNRLLEGEKIRLEKEVSNAKKENDQLKKSLNEANKVVVVYKPRPGHAEPIKPENLSLQASDSAETWHFKYPPGVLSADTLIARASAPWKKTAEDCLKAKRESPRFFRKAQKFDFLAGVGFSFYKGQLVYSPIEFGGTKFNAAPFISGDVRFNQMGGITGSAWGGLKISTSLGR